MKEMTSRPIPNNQGELVPSFLQSEIIWRKFFSEESETTRRLRQAGFIYPGGSALEFRQAYMVVYQSTLCPFCDDKGIREDDPRVDGKYYCICEILKEFEKRIRPNAVRWSSQWGKQTIGIDQMKKVAGPRGQKDITRFIEAQKATKDFIAKPDFWMLYMGKTGTGKTHMLSIIMEHWFPWALYIVASDLEDKLRGLLAEGGDSINDFIHDLQLHPILILDDWGLQHGTEWIQAKIDSIIEFRARDGFRHDRITIMATNYEPDVFKASLERKDGISRSGSRMADRKEVKWLWLSGADYRTIK